MGWSFFNHFKDPQHRPQAVQVFLALKRQVSGLSDRIKRTLGP